MAHPNIQLESIQSFLKLAFDVTAKARARRIRGETPTVISNLCHVKEAAENLSLPGGTRHILLKEAMLRVHCALGRSYREVGQYSQAMDSYRAALDIDPNNELTWFGIGGLYTHLKHIKNEAGNSSISYFANQFVKSAQAAEIGIGIMYYMNGNYEQAVSVWKKLQVAKPEDKALRFLLAKANFIQGIDGTAKSYLRPILQKEACPECAALYIAASKEETEPDILLDYIMSADPNWLDFVISLSNKLERNALELWRIQQDIKKQIALSGGTFNTVWEASDRSGIKPRPANEGAKSGIKGIMRKPL